jgi:hypothetical protein
MKPIFQAGLRDTPEDHRDFRLGAIVSLPALSELPESFSLPTLGVKDQGATDFCAAFATSTLSEIQEGIELSPEFQFALGKVISGDVDEWGLDLRSVLKGVVKLGSLPQAIAPYSLKNQSPEFMRAIGNWPEVLVAKSSPYKKQSYFEITGPYDHYDNIRAAIWKFRNQKQGVLSGLIWQWPLDATFLDAISDEGFGHAIPYIGWTEKGLLLQNSGGVQAGLRGCHIVSRATVNHFVSQFKAYMMVDLSPADAEYLIQNGIKIEDNWLVGLFKALGNLIKLIWS